MRRQQCRWMLLGWLGRSYHLINLAIDIRDDKNIPIFSKNEKDRLRYAISIIYDVLHVLRYPNYETITQNSKQSSSSSSIRTSKIW